MLYGVCDVEDCELSSVRSNAGEEGALYAPRVCCHGDASGSFSINAASGRTCEPPFSDNDDVTHGLHDSTPLSLSRILVSSTLLLLTLLVGLEDSSQPSVLAAMTSDEVVGFSFVDHNTSSEKTCSSSIGGVLP